MMMNSGAKEAKAKERAALARQRVRGIGFATGAAAAALASAFFMFAEPAKAGEAQAAVIPPAAPEQTKIYSLAEATELSKAPQKQMVFHYDANMPEKYLVSVRAQAQALRHHGYFVVAVPGGPQNSVQL
ncbi:MAG TPA: hypothetical protein PLO23_05850, partial [Alphaproteobacteria bacterium]|nr:hypothetical protein [Alphaproteobacteria bacterium]